jgi:hypothetical protein
MKYGLLFCGRKISYEHTKTKHSGKYFDLRWITQRKENLHIVNAEELRRLRQAGNVARVNETTNVYQILIENTFESDRMNG